MVAISSQIQASAERLARAVNGCHAVSNNQAVADLAEPLFATTPDGAISTVAAELK